MKSMSHTDNEMGIIYITDPKVVNIGVLSSFFTLFGINTQRGMRNSL